MATKTKPYASTAHVQTEAKSAVHAMDRMQRNFEINEVCRRADFNGSK